MNIDVMLNTAYLPTKEIKGSIKVDGSTCVPGIKRAGGGGSRPTKALQWMMA